MAQLTDTEKTPKITAPIPPQAHQRDLFLENEGRHKTGKHYSQSTSDERLQIRCRSIHSRRWQLFMAPALHRQREHRLPAGPSPTIARPRGRGSFCFSRLTVADRSRRSALLIGACVLRYRHCSPPASQKLAQSVQLCRRAAMQLWICNDVADVVSSHLHLSPCGGQVQVIPTAATCNSDNREAAKVRGFAFLWTLQCEDGTSDNGLV